jgi:hypothetical protein
MSSSHLIPFDTYFVRLPHSRIWGYPCFHWFECILRKLDGRREVLEITFNSNPKSVEGAPDMAENYVLQSRRGNAGACWAGIENGGKVLRCRRPTQNFGGMKTSPDSSNYRLEDRDLTSGNDRLIDVDQAHSTQDLGSEYIECNYYN